MDVKNRNYLWEVLGLIGVGTVIVAILNPEFWQALYRIIMVLAAIAVVVGIGIGVVAPVFKAFGKLSRQPLRHAEECKAQKEVAQSSGVQRQERMPQAKLTDVRREGETYTKPGDPRQVVYAMYQGRECSVYAPVTGIPVSPEEIKSMINKYKTAYPDKEFPTLEQVQKYQVWYREKYWEPRLHEIGTFIIVR
jgi:hypothetical protein